MIELIDPRGGRAAPQPELATRRTARAGVRRIGFLSNEQERLTGPHFPGYTRILEEAFRKRLRVTQFHREIKPVLSRPAEPDMLARFQGCDGVVNGLAK